MSDIQEYLNEMRRSTENLHSKVLEIRKFEIENFWKRAIFFWGTLAIVFFGYFREGTNPNYTVFIAFIGLLYNIIFSLSLRGSKYWQEHWEIIASDYEKKHPEYKMFELEAEPKWESKFTNPYHFSVSKLTMLLSDITIIVWLFFWVKDLINLFRKNVLKFEFSLENNNIHYFTVGVVVFHLSLFLYFCLFMYHGKVYYKREKPEKEN